MMIEHACDMLKARHTLYLHGQILRLKLSTQLLYVYQTTIFEIADII